MPMFTIVGGVNGAGKSSLSGVLKDCLDDLGEYIVGITPNLQMYNQTVVKYGFKTLDSYNTPWEESPQVVMGNQDYALCNNFTIARGRNISQLDIENYGQVCILGSKMASSLFNYVDPLGKDITINGIPFTVIGVFEEKDPQNMSGMDRYILTPYTASRVLNKNMDIKAFGTYNFDVKFYGGITASMSVAVCEKN